MLFSIVSEKSVNIFDYFDSFIKTYVSNQDESGKYIVTSVGESSGKPTCLSFLLYEKDNGPAHHYELLENFESGNNMDCIVFSSKFKNGFKNYLIEELSRKYPNLEHLHYECSDNTFFYF